MSLYNGRRILIAGNWKMYKTGDEAVEYIEKLKAMLPKSLRVDVALAPTFTALASAVKAAAGSPISISAQNMHWETEGAYTGEISAPMIKAAGASMVIIGHSERRQYFGEDDEKVNRKVKAALKGGLIPIVCIGETLEQREQNQTFSVLETQIKKGLAAIGPEDAAKLILAYEPVWAIGTGKTATPETAQEAHHFIRGLLVDQFNKELANAIRILYGGSVKPANAVDLMGQADIDGALVGGASLKPEDFIGIILYQK